MECLRRLLVSIGLPALATLIGGATAALIGGTVFVIGSMFPGSDNRGRSRTARANSAASGTVISDLCIAETDVAFVCGRSNENIKEIETKTKTSILVKDEPTAPTGRRLEIQGKAEDVESAKALILQIIDSKPQIDIVEILLPHRVIKRLTEKRSDTVARIEKSSRCRIDVDGTTDSRNNNKVSLKGTREQIAKAKLLIEKEVQKIERELEAKPKVAGGKRHVRSEDKPPLLFQKFEEGDEEACSPKMTRRLRKETLPGSSEQHSVAVFVSSVGDPSHFYVQKAGQPSIELDKLVADMSAFYDNDVNRTMNSLTDVSVGSVVAVRSAHDGKWYRAQVAKVWKDHYDESKVDVEIDYVDFGDAERKSLKEVFDVNPHFLNFPVQAIDCCLAGVKPSDEKWSEAAIDEFERLTKCARWVALEAHVAGYRSCLNGSQVPVVQLTYESSEEEVNIGDELVRRGHALSTASE